MAIDDVLPIDEYEAKHFKKLSDDIKCHIENFIESPHEVYDLKRMIFQSLRQEINDFDSRPSTVPNIGINDDKMCARRYRKISRQVCKMGGWANFESYINNSFVNEANEFYKLAEIVEALSEETVKANGMSTRLQCLIIKAKKLIQMDANNS